MPTVAAYNKVCAGRTRAAQTVLASPALLALYESLGGLREDLEQIVLHGLSAEAANLGQSTAVAERGGATGETLLTFEQLREEYVAVMRVIPAVRADLARLGAAPATLAAVDQIIKNEVPVRVIAVEKDGATKKTTRRTESLEAIRAEIQKDAAALLGLAEVQPALARRKVDAPRLAKLAESAEALSGKLGEKSVAKGAAKAATAREREAVKAQKEAWAASYRILAAVGRADPRVQALLSEAAATR